MKTIVALAVLCLSSVSFAAAECPAGSETVLTCTSNPQPGNGQLASDMLDSVAICESGSVTSMVMEKDGESATTEVAVLAIPGGTHYSVEDDTVLFKFSVVTGVRTVKPKATFSVTFTEAKDDNGNPLSSSSTYACSRL
ncbi:MAG: hypothetical protein IPJ84_10500 [Bdellovibrionales bacterium]|nr:hypothetical protein [Bdellovibrionales bacterium]